MLALVALSGANPQLLMDWVGVAAEPRLPEVCTWMGAGSASCSVFASFLPGISQVLANVVTSSDALGQVPGTQQLQLSLFIHPLTYGGGTK